MKCFVFVLLDDKNRQFWVERVTDSHKNGNSVVFKLSVHFHQVGAEAESYTGTYFASFIQSRVKSHDVPWESSL